MSLSNARTASLAGMTLISAIFFVPMCFSPGCLYGISSLPFLVVEEVGVPKESSETCDGP